MGRGTLQYGVAMDMGLASGRRESSETGEARTAEEANIGFLLSRNRRHLGRLRRAQGGHNSSVPLRKL